VCRWTSCQPGLSGQRGGPGELWGREALSASQQSWRHYCCAHLSCALPLPPWVPLALAATGLKHLDELVMLQLLVQSILPPPVWQPLQVIEAKWASPTARRPPSGWRDIAQTATGKLGGLCCPAGRGHPPSRAQGYGVTQSLTHLPLLQTPVLPPPGTDGD